MRTFFVVPFAWLSLIGGAHAQIVAETPPPSQAAPVPETAAEANRQAVPGPPVTYVERSATPGQPDTIVTIYPSNLSLPPPAAFDRIYPPCSATLQDGCRNSGALEETDQARQVEPVEERPSPSPRG